MNNGGRLTGEIILLDGGKLALKTQYAGQVLIDWKDIDTLRSEKPLLIKREDLDSQHSRSLGETDSDKHYLIGVGIGW